MNQTESTVTAISKTGTPHALVRFESEGIEYRMVPYANGTRFSNAEATRLSEAFQKGYPNLTSFKVQLC